MSPCLFVDQGFEANLLALFKASFVGTPPRLSGITMPTCRRWRWVILIRILWSPRQTARGCHSRRRTHARGLEDVEKPAAVVQKSLQLALRLLSPGVLLLSSFFEHAFRGNVVWKAKAALSRIKRGGRQKDEVPVNLG